MSIQGCMKFVGYHIFEPHSMYACCEDSSDFCEAFLDEQLDLIGFEYEYDDDDGYFQDTSGKKFRQSTGDDDDFQLDDDSVQSGFAENDGFVTDL